MIEQKVFDRAKDLNFSEKDSNVILNYMLDVFSGQLSDDDSDGDIYFIENSKHISQIGSGSASIDVPPVQYIDFRHDFLGRRLGQFSFWKAFNIAALTCIEPVADCAVVASARNEGVFIIEWIAHYRAIGFHNIYIYTNDNTDGSTSLLKELARHGYIKLIINETSNEVNPQIKSYEHALLLCAELRKYRWLTFLDCDEFLVLDQKYNFLIQNFIKRLESLPAREVPACVCFNWLWFGSQGTIAREDRNVTERFLYAAPTSLFVKSFFRPKSVLSMRHVHKASLRPGELMVNGGLHQISGEAHDTPFDFSEGRINHYWNKSFEEFLVKQARGVERNIWQRNTELFFEWDIDPTKANFVEFSQTLVERIAEQQKAIRNFDSIRQSEVVARETYKKLSEAKSLPEKLDEFYRISRFRHQIISKLNTELKYSKQEQLINFKQYIKDNISLAKNSL